MASSSGDCGGARGGEAVVEGGTTSSLAVVAGAVGGVASEDSRADTWAERLATWARSAASSACSRARRSRSTRSSSSTKASSDGAG
eukprot:4330233-Pleurochrysis_carterae.AAC.1